MEVKNGKHRLVGFVELGALHDDMLRLEGNMLHPILEKLPSLQLNVFYNTTHASAIIILLVQKSFQSSIVNPKPKTKHSCQSQNEKGIARPTQTPLCGFTLATHEPLRANVAKNQTFSKYCGNSSKINSAHILMLGRP